MAPCKICNKEFKNINGLAKHIFHTHSDITREEYYQLYVNTESKLCCCGKIKKFRDLGIGYLKHCSQECLKNDPIFKQKHREAKSGLVQTPETIKKRQKTIEDRYGVSNGFLVNHPKIFKYKGFTTRSSYERSFIDFAEEFDYSISVPDKIRYIFQDTSRWYYPDFYIHELNLIVEIKSKWTYKLHEEMTKTKFLFTKKAGFDIILINESHGLLDNWEKLNEYHLSTSRS